MTSWKKEKEEEKKHKLRNAEWYVFIAKDAMGRAEIQDEEDVWGSITRKATEERKLFTGRTASNFSRILLNQTVPQTFPRLIKQYLLQKPATADT